MKTLRSDFKPKPEYTIYKENIKIGQSTTWYGALAVLVAGESLTKYTTVHTGTQYISIVSNKSNYRIVKERG